jgi:hypothetical protein
VVAVAAGQGANCGTAGTADHRPHDRRATDNRPEDGAAGSSDGATRERSLLLIAHIRAPRRRKADHGGKDCDNWLHMRNLVLIIRLDLCYLILITIRHQLSHNRLLALPLPYNICSLFAVKMSRTIPEATDKAQP